MASLNRRGALGLALSLLVTSCMLPTGSLTGKGGTDSPRATGSKRPSESPATSASPSTGVSGSTAPSVAPSLAPKPFFGQVLGVDGKPAADVAVRGFLIANGEAAGPLVGNNGGNVIGNNGGNFRVLQAAALTTRTDAEGKFELKSPDGSAMNIEAVLDDATKAIKLDVAATASGITLQLAATGAISGKVSAPNAPTVTDFEGVDVFIPGTSYAAKTNAEGVYTLSGVPAGTFSLVATKEGLGRANLHGVAVASKVITQADVLPLSVTAPTISKIEPANAGPGATVTITGANFGAATGAAFEVAFNGSAAIAPERLSDTTIKAVVPVGATSGNVVVEAGNITGNGQLFTVLKRMTISPTNTKLNLGTSRGYEVSAFDTGEQLVANPVVTWSTTGTAIEVAGGKVTAKAVGSGTLKAASGTVATSAELEVGQGWATVTTLTGSTRGSLDGELAKATFNDPIGITADEAGNFYVSCAGSRNLRKIGTNGQVTTLAGNGDEASLDGTGTDASMNGPFGLAMGPDGNLYLAEYAANKVRKITPAGVVTTLAGTGAEGGADGPGAEATFKQPRGIAVDDDGNVYVGDADTKIRKIAPDGTVSTLVGSDCGDVEGTGTNAKICGTTGLAMGPDGNLYVVSLWLNKIHKITPAGVVTSLHAGKVTRPFGLAIAPDGTMYITELPDGQSPRLKKITPDGTATVIAGGTATGAFDGVGPEVQFNAPHYMVFGKDNALYLTDREHSLIRKIVP